jgi:cobalt-zinc-cadmium efflux system membrane fusion protein
MKRLRALLVLATLCAGGIGCQRSSGEKKSEHSSEKKAPPSAEHRDEPEHAALPRRVRLDPRVIADAKIRTAPVVAESLAPTIDLPGEIASDPDKTARVSALVAGRLESVSFKEGQEVKKGDVLAVIKVPELGKTKAAYAATAAKAVSARSNADRLQALSTQRLAGSQEVLAAGAEAAALEAEARAAEEQLRALGMGTSGGVSGSQLALRAPVPGVIVARDALVGQPVTADQTIATIADLKEVWFLARVFEKNLGQTHIGAPADVQLNAYPKERFQGVVEYLGKQIDPAARTVTARIRLTNRGDLLRIGLFGVAHVGTAEDTKKAPVLVVPRDAVTDVGGKPVVFVQQPDGDFDVHDLVLGESALGKVQVVSGLRAGEPVVVDGVFTLKSAVLKRTFGEEQ